MADITHNDPVVTESKLTEFYNDIKPFLGCPAYVTQEGDAEYYSTDEKVVGRWTDGKPLYQKTIYAATATKYLNIQDMTGKELKQLDGVFDNGTAKEVLPYADNGGYVCLVHVLSNNLQVYLNTFSSVTNLYVTIRYTKSADSATTTVEQKPTHYSTDEQVVGYWVDGRPVYQKTTKIDMEPTSTTDYIPETQINNLDSILEISFVGQRVRDGGYKDRLFLLPTMNLSGTSPYGITYTCNDGRGHLEGDAADNTRIYTISNTTGKAAAVYVTMKYTKSTDI